MRKRGVFFVHVMKTGGGSLFTRMRRWFPDDAVYPAPDDPEPVFSKTIVRELLELRESERRPRDFYSVHMPAWVADAVAPHHLHVTVLREPVARTISHLRHIADATQGTRTDPPFESLEEIYDDPRWHDRLVNYQVRIFAATRAEDEREREQRLATLPRAADAPPGFLRPVMTTGIESCTELGEDALERAIATLDRFDVVGITDGLDRFLEQVAHALGHDHVRVGHGHRGSNALEASETLVERVRADHELDARLYEHARACVPRA